MFCTFASAEWKLRDSTLAKASGHADTYTLRRLYVDPPKMRWTKSRTRRSAVVDSTSSRPSQTQTVRR